jgi:glycosyltransferase involved in cell wall biosynthesis
MNGQDGREMAPLVSIIIPHLNQPVYLRRCLRSLVDQAFDMSRVEIIVVDNGSKEPPYSTCCAFENVVLQCELSPGPGHARNKGVDASVGEILACIDADCIADKNWLSAICSAFDDQQAQIVGGDVRIALANPDRMTMLEAYESIYAYRQKEYIERMGFSGTGNLAMRRQAYHAVGRFAGIGVAEDREWGQRATRMGISIRFIPEMVVFHPARRSFAELGAKWDRHVAHDYAEQVRSVADRLRWSAKIALLAVSPIWETGRILHSKKIYGSRARCLALVVLIRIRLLRAWRMMDALFRGQRAIRSDTWNRGSAKQITADRQHPHEAFPENTE